MANPQCEHGFTRIANELYDVALRELRPPEYIVWSAVIRVTYGYGRKEAEVTVAALAAMCAMCERQVRAALAALVARGVLYATKRGPKPMLVGVQKDYDQWAERPAENRQSLDRKTGGKPPLKTGGKPPLKGTVSIRERNKRKKDPQPSSLEAMEVAQKYHARIRTILPSLARSIGSQADEKGAAALDALVRIDGHDWELVKSVLRWALTDEFWARNLRSLASVRTRGKNGSTKFENCLAQFELCRETVRAHGAPAVQTITHTLTEDELTARRAANALWRE